MDEKAPVILIHGLGGSYVNWMAIADQLAHLGPIYAPDLIGFGLTAPKGRRSSVENNADLVVALIEHLGGGPVTLVGHSMGGLISLKVANAHPELVSRLVLLDPALPLRFPNLDPRGLVQFFGPHLPVLAVAAARKMPFGEEPENIMITGLKLLVADPQAIEQDVLDAHLAVARKRLRLRTGRAFLEASASTTEELLRPGRFRKLAAGVEAPVLLIHGRQDRLIPISAAKWIAKAQPSWRFEILDGVGHIPQIEAPTVTADVISDWLESEEVAAA